MSQNDSADDPRGAGVPRLPSESPLARSMASKSAQPDLTKVEETTAKGGVVDAPTRTAPASSASEVKSQSAARPTNVGVRRAVPQALRATVQVRRIDPWTTLKVTLVMATAGFFIWMLAVGLLYIVLAGMGVWDRLNSAFVDIVSTSSSEGLISAGQVFGYSAIVGLINVVLLTAFSTIGAFIYNLCADLVGGIQITLADPD